MMMGKAQQGKWELVALGDVTDVASGAGFPTRFQGNESGEYPFYKVSDMNLVGNETWMMYHNNAIDEGVRREIKAKAYPKGTIIFPKIGAAIATNKKRILSTDACFDNNVIGILPSERLDTGYLYHLLLCKDLSDFANTGNPPSIRKTTLERWQFPLPTLEEQKRIAKILDAADAMRTKRRESLAQLDALLQSTFFELFGDPVSNTKNWQARPLGEMMRIRRGGSPRPIDKYLGGTINWIKIGDATRSGDDIYITSCAEKITEDGLSKTTFLDEGSFVFANSGVSLGFARILKVKGAIHDGWLAFDRFSDDVLNKLFFLKALNQITLHFRRTAPSGTQPNLNTGIMKSFMMIVPPIDMQNKFAKFVEGIEQQKVLLRKHLDELDILMDSLQSHAFSGEL